MNEILNPMLFTILFIGFVDNCKLAARLYNADPPTKDIQSLYENTFALAVFNAAICLAMLAICLAML